MHSKEIEWHDLDSNHFDEDGDLWWVLVKTELNYWFL
jgi:hypothetical protein